MQQVKFGYRQMRNPTPANLGRTVTIISVVLGVFIGWSSTTNIIPHPADDYVNGILGLLLALCNALKPLFGVDVQTKTVATEDVASIEPQGK